jgi:hypothetical protein
MLAEVLGESSRDFRPALKASAGLLAALALGAVIWLFFFAPPRLRSALLADRRPWGLVAGLMLTALALGAMAHRFFRTPATRLNGLTMAALACLPLFLASFHGLPEAFTNRRAPSVLLAEAGPLTPPEAALFTDRKVLYAAAWHYRRNDITIAFWRGGELAYGLARPEGRDRYVADAAALADRVRRELAAGRPAAVITSGAYELDGLEPEQLLQKGDFIWRLYRPGTAGPE